MPLQDDDLEQVPWWDAQALRIAETVERSIVRLRLDSPGEFIAIINAIEMQLADSGDYIVEVDGKKLPFPATEGEVFEVKPQ